MTAVLGPRILGFLLPHQERRDGPGLALRWCVHLGLLAALLVGLWYANQWGDLGRWLRSPWPILHRVWLPLLVIAFYLIGWLSVGMWSALRRGPVMVWPDLDAAWNEVRQVLCRADIDIARTPLFLILGPMPRAVEAALESLGAAALPLGGAAPFRVFVNAQAIYVVAARLSRLAQMDDWHEAGVSSRWQHFCELLLEERLPRAPIQGVVLMVPYAATESNVAARKAIRACQADVRDLRDATGLDLPIHLAMCDVDPLPGGSDAHGLAAWVQHFPPRPDLDPAEVALMYEQGLDWLFTTRICRAAEDRLRIDPTSDRVEGIGQALAGNILVHQWLAGVLTRRKRFAQILVEATQNELMEPSLVASCYLAPGGLSPDAACELTRNLCFDLLAQRDSAAWTTDTFARARSQRRLAWLGFSLGLAGFAALVTGIALTFLDRAG